MSIRPSGQREYDVTVLESDSQPVMPGSGVGVIGTSGAAADGKTRASPG
jgi:hypothetical protein